MAIFISAYSMGIVVVATDPNDLKEPMLPHYEEMFNEFLEASKEPFVRSETLNDMEVRILTAETVNHNRYTPNWWWGRGKLGEVLQETLSRAELAGLDVPHCMVEETVWIIRKNALQLMFAEHGYKLFENHYWSFIKKGFGEIFCRGFEAACRELNGYGNGPIRIPTARRIAELEKKIRKRYFDAIQKRV